jgi:hypothetical protein
MSKLIADQQNIITTYFPHSGLLLQNDKDTGRCRTSIDSWPDLESAKKAFERGEMKWGGWIE